MESDLSLREDVLNKINCIEYREDPNIKTIRSYILRSKKLGKAQIRALNENLDDFAFYFKKEHIDLSSVFGNDNKVIIEIGFGSGDRLLDSVLNFPNINFIGIEVYINGFANLLSKASKLEISNLKIIRFDAVDVLNYMIEDESVFGFEVFFPDPWPKKKHHKKRLVNVDFISLISRKLLKNGYFRMVTDDDDYANEVVQAFSLNGIFSGLNLENINEFDGGAISEFLNKSGNSNEKFTELKQIINHNLLTPYNLKAKSKNKAINVIFRLKQ